MKRLSKENRKLLASLITAHRKQGLTLTKAVGDGLKEFRQLKKQSTASNKAEGSPDSSRVE